MFFIKARPSAQTVTNQLANAVADIVRQVSRDLYTEVKRFTPKRSGRARQNWRYRQRDRFEYNVSNKTPYIASLDAGYSKKAPDGIVRPAVKEVANKLKRRRKV
jgi:hypothetical protein